jgi:hypothetical protein
VDAQRLPARVERLAARVDEQGERLLGRRLVQDGRERAVPAVALEDVRAEYPAQVGRLVGIQLQVGLVHGVKL